MGVAVRSARDPGFAQFYRFKGRTLNPIDVVKTTQVDDLGWPMFGAFSVLSVVAGSALAYGAKRHPSRIETLETCAGALLILGFTLLGSALPHFS
jgi:hypothetical protein